MTNEMSKRFREINKEMLWVADEEVDDVLFFLQSEIDLVVAEERKRIQVEIMKQLDGFFDWAEQIKEKEIGHWVMMYGISPNEFRQMFLSLINKTQ